jgi:hypothetical protein
LFLMDDNTQLPVTDGQIPAAPVQDDQAQVTPAPAVEEPLIGETPATEVPAADGALPVVTEEGESFEDEQEVGEETPADTAL